MAKIEFPALIIDLIFFIITYKEPIPIVLPFESNCTIKLQFGDVGSTGLVTGTGSITF